MAKIGFEAPDRIGDVINLLNQAEDRDHKWRLTLVMPDGKVQGHLQVDHGALHTLAGTDYAVLNGDVDDDRDIVMFRTTDGEAALTFLYGVYYGVFGGIGLEEVQDKLTRRAAIDRY